MKLILVCRVSKYPNRANSLSVFSRSLKSSPKIQKITSPVMTCITERSSAHSRRAPCEATNRISFAARQIDALEPQPSPEARFERSAGVLYEMPYYCPGCPAIFILSIDKTIMYCVPLRNGRLAVMTDFSRFSSNFLYNLQLPRRTQKRPKWRLLRLT
jgi:hypothetical protein